MYLVSIHSKTEAYSVAYALYYWLKGCPTIDKENALNKLTGTDKTDYSLTNVPRYDFDSLDLEELKLDENVGDLEYKTKVVYSELDEENWEENWEVFCEYIENEFRK